MPSYYTRGVYHYLDVYKVCVLFPRCVRGGFIIASMGVYEEGLLLPPWVCMMGVYYCLHGCV